MQPKVTSNGADPLVGEADPVTDKGAVTTMDVVHDPVCDRESVTVTITVRVPAVAKTWVGFWSVLEPPSSKSQL